MNIYRDILGLQPVYPPTVRNDERIYAFRGMIPGAEKYKHQIFRPQTLGVEQLHLGYLALAPIVGGDGNPVPLDSYAGARAKYGGVELMFVTTDVVDVNEKLQDVEGVTIHSIPRPRQDGTYSQLMAYDIRTECAFG